MQRLLQYVEYLGHSPFVICQKVQSDYSGIMNQSLSFSEEQIEEMWKICIELTNIPELGFHLGQYLSIESMGTFGMLLQNVSNIHEGLEVASNFTGLVSDYFMIDLSVDDKEFTVSLSPEKSFREAFPVRTKQGCLITYSLMIKMYAVLTMKKPRLNYVAMPPYVQDRQLLSYCYKGRMELHPTDYILKCDKTILELPIVNANELLKPHIYQAANRELDAKNMEFRREVYSYFNDTYPECFPSLESTAQALGLSPRTLQRRLKKENTTFHDVLVEFKVNLAKSLLSKNQTAKQIAGKLGYSKVSNFYSSFKKWTGMTVNDFMKLN